jgi:hypothetical protein
MTLRYFKSSFFTLILGLLLGAGVGFYYGGPSRAMEAMLTCFLLAMLELSISFDNAVVNATVLKDMSPLWQRRFMTWGMLLAVFGMRFIFPLGIVSIAVGKGPWQALILAATSPKEYAAIMLSVHHEVAAFGGTFLLLVALKYFFDHEKDVFWLEKIEKFFVKIGRIEAIEIGLAILVLMILSYFVDSRETLPFIKSGLLGILVFLVVEGISFALRISEEATHSVHKASIGMFIYLEVLDASFSFDGVVGAFALTNNLFIICIGLGIGAMFVRSLTLLMVERGTLEQFRFLEHGAFYAVGCLAVIMFLNTIWEIPEVVTGLLGAFIILMALISSLRYRRKRPH